MKGMTTRRWLLILPSGHAGLHEDTMGRKYALVMSSPFLPLDRRG
jgi:hypothetical protein